MERRDNPLKIVRLTIIAFVSLIIGLSLIGDARGQTRGCYFIDRSREVCIETMDEVFSDSALYGSPYKSELYVLAHDVGAERNAYQQWIHDNRPACCDHRDCIPAQVKWTPQGWTVAGADNLIAPQDVIRWPFPIPYACVINRHVRCLFLNTGG